MYDDLSGPPKTIFHTAKESMCAASHNSCNQISLSNNITTLIRWTRYVKAKVVSLFLDLAMTA